MITYEYQQAIVVEPVRYHIAPSNPEIKNLLSIPIKIIVVATLVNLFNPHINIHILHTIKDKYERKYWLSFTAKTLPSINAFSSKAKVKYEIEKYICVKTNNMDRFNKMWALSHFSLYLFLSIHYGLVRVKYSYGVMYSDVMLLSSKYSC